MAITIKNMSFSRQGKPILQDINLTAKPHKIIALLGTNGAGKTTLLQILTGELIAEHGVVELNNHPRSYWSLQEQAQMLAVLPQTSTLNFPLSVEEVVLLGRTPHVTSYAENHAIVMQCLQTVDMQHFAKKLYTHLSGGERQRVQIARAIAQICTPITQGPRYLLLDEPTSALDIAHQHQILHLLQQLTKQDIGIIIVLHDLNLAMQYADQAVVLQQGHLIAEGKPEEILTASLIAQAYGLHVHLLPHPDMPGKQIIVPSIKP